ncbi:PTS fructose transporter subunit IIB [Halorubrum pallidum]|uniref:PTS fructose transporter subunit IIB n=1 Tax=Halorubrum pallidum TaxID=1526114 RepID=A0ABD5T129_9EURY
MNFAAVTACPTGIAHSQMAAENLKTTAEERGHEIHVEVQGAMGTENEIPPDVIAGADAVIIAADTSVQTDRFDGKIVVKGSVKDGVNDAGGMIDEAVERAESEDDASAGTSDSVSEADTSTVDTSDTDGSTADSQSTDRSSSDGGLVARLKRLFS